MGKKKRRSSKFKDSSTVIDIEQARKERQQRQQERHEKRKKAGAKNRPSRSGAGMGPADAAGTGSRAAAGPEGLGAAADTAVRDQTKRERYRDDGSVQGTAPYSSPQMNMRHDRRRMALRRRKRNRTLIVAGILVMLIVMVIFSFGNIIVLKHDLYTAEKEQEHYIEEKEQLEKDMAQINDRENLEEQARDQMRLIMPGETLYIFPEDMTQTEAAADSEQDDKEASDKDKEQEKQEQ